MLKDAHAKIRTIMFPDGSWIFNSELSRLTINYCNAVSYFTLKNIPELNSFTFSNMQIIFINFVNLFIIL